jgi:hypothetical protein
MGQERPFRHLSEESGLPPTPDILRHRSEPPLWGQKQTWWQAPCRFVDEQTSPGTLGRESVYIASKSGNGQDRSK